MGSCEEKVKHDKSKMGFQDDGYGLRENPKKSWKFSGCNSGNTPSNSMQEIHCKVCGKIFETVKALYGHMRHHSGKERKRSYCKECGRGFLSLKSLSNHVRGHSEKLKLINESGTCSRPDLAVGSSHVKKKRSRRTRYKFTTTSCISSFNESLSGTEIDQEVKHVAMCLMMLSRGRFYEFSDNDSVTFEVESLNQNKRRDGYFDSSGNVESLKMKKPKEEKLDSWGSESFIAWYEKRENQCIEFDSGIEVNEEKNVELEVSTEMDDEPGFASYATEVGGESSGDLMKGVGLNQSGLGIMKSTSRKKANFDAEFGGVSCNKVICYTSDSETWDDSLKKYENKCKTCNKKFRSRQALGGHQRMHGTKKRIDNSEKQNHTSILPDIESGRKLEYIGKLMEQEDKVYKCGICFKGFTSGQALGGHQRAHLWKSSETRTQQIVMHQEYSGSGDELDTNTPVRLDEEAKRDVGFKSWWLGRNYEHEPLVSLVAN